MAYSKNSNRIYLGYGSGEVTYISPVDTFKELPFTSTDYEINGMVTFGEFLFVGGKSKKKVFDPEGSLVESVDTKYYNESYMKYVWSETLGRVYYNSNGTLSYIQFNKLDGTLVSEGEVITSGKALWYSSVAVSEDGSNIFSGHAVYDTESMDIKRFLNFETDFPEVASWTADNELLFLYKERDFYLSRTRRYDNRGILVEAIDGREDYARYMFPYKDEFIIISSGPKSNIFTYYKPNNDTDGDGVDNLKDAFPYNPAASIDEDRDAYPDAWNPGIGEEDNKMGLKLDAYPGHSACFSAGRW